MRILPDNDVVLDFLLRRQPFFAAADEIFVRLQNKENYDETAKNLSRFFNFTGFY
jgi:hypothetical protein